MSAMTIRAAVKEAARRWDQEKPTAWRGAGRASYHGAAAYRTVTQAAKFGSVETRVECSVGYWESWPGCCMGYHPQGAGKTFEDAFVDADTKAAKALAAAEAAKKEPWTPSAGRAW